MKSFFADLLRSLFRIKIINNRFYGIHRILIAPLKLFKGVQKTVRIENEILVCLEIDDWIQERLFLTGKYENAEISFLKKYIKPGFTVVDIGANIGLHSLYMCKLVGEQGFVHSFEPFQKNFKSLKRNISLNHFQNIALENIAVSDSASGIEVFYNSDTHNLGAVTMFPENQSYSERVNSITLDHYAHEKSIKKIDFVKIDIEGGEYPALMGMKKILISHSPILLIEIEPKILSRTPYTEENIINFLSENNYTLYSIDENGNLSKNKNLRKSFNFVFLQNNSHTFLKCN